MIEILVVGLTAFVVGSVGGRLWGLAEQSRVKRVYTLHADGEEDELPVEADRKNAALHEFLRGADIEEWEGCSHTPSGSGITIWIAVDSGDHIVRYHDDSVRVIRGGR